MMLLQRTPDVEIEISTRFLNNLAAPEAAKNTQQVNNLKQKATQDKKPNNFFFFGNKYKAPTQQEKLEKEAGEKTKILDHEIRETLSGLNQMVFRTNVMRSHSEESQNVKLDLLQGLDKNEESEKFATNLDECETIYTDCIKSTRAED